MCMRHTHNMFVEHRVSFSLSLMMMMSRRERMKKRKLLLTGKNVLGTFNFSRRENSLPFAKLPLVHYF